MRIYNAKDSQISFPLSGERITVAPHSASGNFMPNEDLLSLLITVYNDTQIAIIVSGAAEVSLCSRISGTVPYIVYNLEDAIAKFVKKDEMPTETVEEVRKETEPVADIPAETPAPVPVEEEPVKETTEAVKDEEPKAEEPVEKKPLIVKRTRKTTKK